MHFRDSKEKIRRLKCLYAFSLTRQTGIQMPDKYELCDAFLKGNQIFYLIKDGELSHKEGISLLELSCQKPGGNWKDRQKIAKWHICSKDKPVPVDTSICLIDGENSLLHSMVDGNKVVLRKIDLNNASIQEWGQEDLSSARKISYWDDKIYVPDLCSHSILIFDPSGKMLESIYLPIDFPETVIPLDADNLLIYFFRGYDGLTPYRRSNENHDRLGIYNKKRKEISFLKNMIPTQLKIGLARLLRNNRYFFLLFENQLIKYDLKCQKIFETRFNSNDLFVPSLAGDRLTLAKRWPRKMLLEYQV